MISSSLQISPIPRGASLYYALLFSSENYRSAIAIISAFEREIGSIAEKMQEPQVAKAKLSWWSQEITHAYQGKPHHPLSRILVPLIDQYALPQVWFQQIITAVQSAVEGLPVDQFESLRLFCKLHAGKILLLSKILNHPKDCIPEEFAVLLSTSIQIIQMIRFFGKDCANGKISFPTQDIALFNITENQLFQRNCSQAQLQNLLSLQARRAKEYYDKALCALPSTQRLSQQPLIILAKIYLVLLQEIEKEQFAVLHHKYSLTPLRKFWVAWSTHLSEKKTINKLSITA